MSKYNKVNDLKGVNDINGVRFIKNDKYALCLIDNLSEELKDNIRSQLTSICHGPSKASIGRKAHNYKNTLKEFIKRYETKPLPTRVGMIGEMLTHILIIEYFTEFNTVSPYFNLEERSIKKGFDLVLFSNNEKELWITEVKSGELHQNKNSNETSKVLLGNAKRDLKKRLNEQEISFWENAINGAYVALAKKKDIKDAVVELLLDIEDTISDQQSKSTDKNVLLVGSLFSNLSDEVIEEEIQKISISVEQEKLFGKLIVFSIQKNTYENVISFLMEEAEK